MKDDARGTWKIHLRPEQRELLAELVAVRAPALAGALDRLDDGVSREVAGAFVQLAGHELAQSGFVDTIRMNERGLALERLIDALTTDGRSFEGE